MGKILTLRDYILLGAAVGGEAFEEFRLLGGLIPSIMEARYGFVPARYKRQSYMSAVSRHLSTGNIKRVTGSDGKVCLELTSGGNVEVKRTFPLLVASGKKWDGNFMMVIFDVPETHKKVRDRLRAKLGELGFGMLQKSIWISPYHFEEDIRQFLRAQDLDDIVYVLAAKKLWEKDFKRLALRVWELDKLNSRYLGVISILREGESERLQSKKHYKRAFNLFMQTLALDPLLPQEFLPSDWARVPALKLLNSLGKI
ncbi:MAG: hypothetical protein HYW33_01525 [Candidatus Blackburnbacteria bacterium]|nr:hypothetical protein [Candidatus Blackburnbacteria bacterium]